MGNAVRLLCDAGENYPAWLDAIERATRCVHFETYILHEDSVGERFASAFVAKARAGVAVRVVYDWMGGLGNSSRRFWRRLAEAGVAVRCYNPARLDEPFGWLSRDHRKCVVVDDEVAFVTGLCVGRMWEGDPARGLAPWRDTGVEVRGPAVAEVARAFADSWAACGAPLPQDAPAGTAPEPAGDIALRVVAGTPGTTGLFRVDQLVAALARRSLWLTDAYYAGMSAYVQALRAAALDGVDVRLLVPGRGSDIPVMQTISRAGYRTLLEAGVRVFEWNGPMVHAKTAVADGRWARVGSTNLNLASWIGNRELDVIVEDDGFARAMEQQYLKDLEGSTEVVLRAQARAAGGRREDPAYPRRRGQRESRGGRRSAARQRGGGGALAPQAPQVGPAARARRRRPRARASGARRRLPAAGGRLAARRPRALAGSRAPAARRAGLSPPVIPLRAP